MPHLDSLDKMRGKVEEGLVNDVIKALTTPVAVGEEPAQPKPRELVFKGNLAAVNEFFHKNRWSDGLPVIPPTIDRIKEFLKFTDRSPDEVIGVLLPSQCTATVWNVAVNGVIAGCRPEYMPVLLAIVEVMADERFGLKHFGHTPGNEALITLNGPIIKELGFNYETGALRVGYQANTSIGRFFRLFLINVARFVVGQTDKPTFGGTWRVVLAENDDAVARIGWEPTSVELGFKEGDNLVNIRGGAALSVAFASTGERAEDHLDRLVDMTSMIDQGLIVVLVFGSNGIYPQVIISPCVAEIIAKAGYSKADVKRYLYEHTKLPAWRLEYLIDAEMHNSTKLSLCDFVARGDLPAHFCESKDPNRLVPTAFSPDNFTITVSGDPQRNRNIVCLQNGFIGVPVTKKVALPGNWDDLMAKSKA